MSLITLLVAIVGMLLLSNLMDAFPGVLWGWIHFPQWMFWVLGLCIFAWCTGEPE